MRKKRRQGLDGFSWALGILLCFPCSGCSGSGGGSDPVCGNGSLEAGEECDDGLEGSRTCSIDCRWQVFTPDPAPSGSSSLPSVAVSPDGDFVIAYQKWAADLDGYDVFAVAYSRSGELLWGPEALHAAREADQTTPRLACGPDGGFAAVWESGTGVDRDVFIRSFSSTGLAGSQNERQVNERSMGDQYGPVVAGLPNGGAVVVWTGLYLDGDGAGVMGRLFGPGPDHSPVGEELVVNTYWQSEQEFPAVAAAPDGRFVVAWESKCQESG